MYAKTDSIGVTLTMMIELALMAALYTDLNNVAPTVEEAFVAPKAQLTTVVEAPYFAWGIRPAIRDIKRDVDIDILYTRGIDCDDYPDAQCLKVTREYLPEVEWMGVYYWEEGNNFYIRLNDYYGNEYKKSKDNAAVHEFTHFLGFSHHDEDGIMGVDTWYLDNRPSDAETEVMVGYYNE